MEEEKRGKLQATAGRVKKQYKGPFNPFKAMEYTYDYFVCLGAGKVVSLVGYGEVFTDNIVSATWHVQRDKKILREGMDPVLPYQSGHNSHDMNTHTGATIRYHNLKDESDAQVTMEAICKESDVICLCSDYQEPVLKNIIKSYAMTKDIRDFSKNNL